MTRASTQHFSDVTCDSTDEEFLEYVNSNFYPNTSRAAIAKILELYPSDPALGAPFNTGDNFTYSPQYKRMAAFQGDFIEQAPRRLFVQNLAERQPVYSYRASHLCHILTLSTRTLTTYK